MYSKSLEVKILSTNKRNEKSKTSIVTSILIAVILVTGLSILANPVENALANPCSHNSGGNGGPVGNGGPGGTGGPGGSGPGTGNTGSTSGLFGGITGNPGTGHGGTGGPGGTGGQAGPGGNGGPVDCSFQGPVTTNEATP